MNILILFAVTAVTTSITAFTAHAETALNDKCIKNVTEVTHQAQLWPATTKKTKAKGWQVLKFLRQGSFYEKIGLLVGDVIVEVNGIKADGKANDPMMVELYNIEGSRANKLKVERDGALESVIYTCPYK